MSWATCVVRGAAVQAALAEQQRHEDGYGVGVELPGGELVPWCRDQGGTLSVLEVQPGDRGDVQETFLRRGFRRHGEDGLAGLGVLEQGEERFAPSGSDEDVTEAVVALLTLLGADEQTDLTTFP